MQFHLDVPFANTTAHSLGYALGYEAVDTLASLLVPCPALDGTIELGILGASHQITLRNAADEAIGVETLACTVASPVPPVNDAVVGGLPYQFICRVHEVTQARLHAFAATLVLTLATEPHGVIATFPGEPQAITGIHLDSISPVSGGTNPLRLRWRSWHLYPGERTVVSTLTRVTLPSHQKPVATGLLGSGPRGDALPLPCGKIDPVRVLEESAGPR